MGAAVDVVGDAGDVARLLPTEEGDEVRDVVNGPAAADRDLRDELRLTLARQALAGEVCFDEPRSDGVDRYPVRSQLSGLTPTT